MVSASLAFTADIFVDVGAEDTGDANSTYATVNPGISRRVLTCASCGTASGA